MSTKRKVDDISREEDFRDYDERNIDQGWPYEDASGAGARPVDNTAYGQPAANFDQDRNGGYRVDQADSSGLEERLADGLRPETMGREEADDLEERITDAIDSLDIVDMDAIDVHADTKGKVTVEGVVDDAVTSNGIAAKIRTVSGVRLVVNNLRTAGVDTRIPDED